MRKSIVAALTLTGALVLGPAAAHAAPIAPYHAGHDHGTKPAKPKPKPSKPKPKDDKKEGHGNGNHGNGAHDSDGYDSHRSHPR
jgi:hypothetical protein